MKEIKPWVIVFAYGIGEQCAKYYGAYATENPTEIDGAISDEFIAEVENELWDDYGYLITGWDNEHMETDYDDDPEAWQDEYDQIIEDFKCDISIFARIDEDEEINDLEIIYDERES